MREVIDEATAFDGIVSNFYAGQTAKTELAVNPEAPSALELQAEFDEEVAGIAGALSVEAKEALDKQPSMKQMGSEQAHGMWRD